MRRREAGRPLNPRGRTWLAGRGLLGKWGPNQAADPIVTRYHPTSGKLQVVAIQRKDTRQWAIPGGMVDDGEAVSATVRREFEEEAGNLGDEAAKASFRAHVDTLFALGETYLFCQLVELKERYVREGVLNERTDPSGEDPSAFDAVSSSDDATKARNVATS